MQFSFRKAVKENLLSSSFWLFPPQPLCLMSTLKQHYWTPNLLHPESHWNSSLVLWIPFCLSPDPLKMTRISPTAVGDSVDLWYHLWGCSQDHRLLGATAWGLGFWNRSHSEHWTSHCVDHRQCSIWSGSHTRLSRECWPRPQTGFVAGLLRGSLCCNICVPRMTRVIPTFRVYISIYITWVEFELDGN